MPVVHLGPNLQTSFIALAAPQEGRKNDFQVQQQATLGDVPRIKSSKPLGVTHVYPVDLSKPRDAWQHAENLMCFTRLYQLGLYRQTRTGSNDAKLPSQNIEHLRQLTSHEWHTFLQQHNLEASMSRRGNCYDNAMAKSFFQLLKRERIRQKTYATREDARADAFKYIEMFYISQRKHTNNGMLSPVEFERQHKMNAQRVQQTKCPSKLQH